MEIDVQTDLDSVNNQISKMAEELNKITNARDQLIQEIGPQNLEELSRINKLRDQSLLQIHHLNGAAMWMRGKLPSVEQLEEVDITDGAETENDFERSAEYPPDN